MVQVGFKEGGFCSHQCLNYVNRHWWTVKRCGYFRKLVDHSSVVESQFLERIWFLEPTTGSPHGSWMVVSENRIKRKRPLFKLTKCLIPVVLLFSHLKALLLIYLNFKFPYKYAKTKAKRNKICSIHNPFKLSIVRFFFLVF